MTPLTAMRSHGWHRDRDEISTGSIDSVQAGSGVIPLNVKEAESMLLQTFASAMMM